MTLVLRSTLNALYSLILTSLFSQSLLASPDLSTLSFHPAPIVGSSLSDRAVQLQPVAAQVGAEYSGNSHANISDFDRAIEALLQAQGPYTLDMAELLQDKGGLLQGLGQHEEALAVLQESLHVIRVNQGLDDGQQVPLLRAMINSKRALQDFEGADELQSALFQLQLARHGRQSVEASQAYIEWADWNVNLYMNAGSEQSYKLRSQEEVNQRLTEAYNQYTNALLLLQKDEAVNQESMVETERKLAAISFIVKRYLGDSLSPALNSVDRDFAVDDSNRARRRSDMMLFKNGKAALQRAVSYSINTEEPDYLNIAERMMELGDWYLLFDRRAAAIELYEDVLAMLDSAGVKAQDAQGILSAGLPVQTPDRAYQSIKADEFSGYIDVEFSLNKFGKASNLQILSSVESDRKIERELLRTIRSGKFRPGFDQDGVNAIDKMQLRYYYTL